MAGPIWSAYSSEERPLARYGWPTSHSYEWYRGEDIGYRTDFSNVSIIWKGGEPENVDILDINNASWNSFFWPEPNHFAGIAHQRRDSFLDFSWADSTRPGPFQTEQGFSAKWVTRAGGPISAYRLIAEFQGHLEILVDGNTVIAADCPDSICSESSIELGIGSERVEVFYWQEGSGQGRIFVTVDNPIIPAAFASEGEIGSSSLASHETTYADFPPPLREEEEAIPAGPSPRTLAEFTGEVFDETTRRFSLEGEGQEVHSGYEGHHWRITNTDVSATASAKWLLNPTSRGRWEVLCLYQKEHQPPRRGIRSSTIIGRQLS